MLLLQQECFVVTLACGRQVNALEQQHQTLEIVKRLRCLLRCTSQARHRRNKIRKSRVQLITTAWSSKACRLLCSLLSSVPTQQMVPAFADPALGVILHVLHSAADNALSACCNL